MQKMKRDMQTTYGNELYDNEDFQALQVNKYTHELMHIHIYTHE